MTSTKTLLLAIALSLPLASGVTLAAETSTHDHSSGAPTALELNAGQKWETDAPLRLAMGELRQTINQALPDVHKGTFDKPQYDALADYTNKQVAYIVGNCNLEPQADAQLHIIVADLIGGADIVSGKEQAHPRADGVVKLVETLNRYGEFFNHPEWQNIALSH
ncbi:hypothetical protein KVP09_07125 [Alcaligenaceae bacterium CGII-47]|nr:hypothetical protein [Alcaligenaceae bacterium CGII-47]